MGVRSVGRPCKTDRPCSICKEPKPRTLEFYYRGGTAADGLASSCKECWKARYRAKYWNSKAVVVSQQAYWDSRRKPDPLDTVLRRLMGYLVKFLPREDAIDCAMETVEATLLNGQIDTERAVAEAYDRSKPYIAMKYGRVSFEEWAEFAPRSRDFAPFLIEVLSAG